MAPAAIQPQGPARSPSAPASPGRGEAEAWGAALGAVGAWASGVGTGCGVGEGVGAGVAVGAAPCSWGRALKVAAGESGPAGVTSKGIQPAPPKYTSTQAWAL